MCLQSKVASGVPVVCWFGGVAWFVVKFHTRVANFAVRSAKTFAGRCKAQLGNKVVGYALPTAVRQSGGSEGVRDWRSCVWQLGQVCVLLGKCRALSGKGRDLFGWNCVLLGRGAVFAGFLSVGDGVGCSLCKTVAQIGWGNFANHLEICIAVWYNG